jgi:MarR family transcriptional regulator, multiple antibiotic resistance protein MarR
MLNPSLSISVAPAQNFNEIVPAEKVENHLTQPYGCVHSQTTMFSYDHNKSLGYLAGLASRLLSNMLGKRFQEAGIEMTAEQWGAVILLLNSDAMTQGQLGERLCLEKSSVSRLVGGLERRGWIARTKSPDDSRHKLVSPTPKALETAERCAAIAKAVLKEAHRGMTEDEQLVCRSFLARIIANIGELAI